MPKKCKRHLWEVIAYDVKPGGETRITYVCIRCGKTKVEVTK